MVKKTKFEFTVNELIQNRWSPRAFSDKKIEKEKLQSIFEAARWSASAFNAQPWRFLVAYKGDENHQKSWTVWLSLISFGRVKHRCLF